MLGSCLQTRGQNPEVLMKVSKRLERDSKRSPNLFTKQSRNGRSGGTSLQWSKNTRVKYPSAHLRNIRPLDTFLIRLLQVAHVKSTIFVDFFGFE